MLGLGGVLVVCEECYITLGKLIVCYLCPPPPPPFYCVFENSNLLMYNNKIQGMSSLPVIGTIFLVIINITTLMQLLYY